MKKNLSDFHIGQFVISLKEVGESASGDSPGGICAGRGELLVVRSINDKDGVEWPIAVSHEHRTDASFCVGVGEVRPAGKIVCRAEHNPSSIFIEYIEINSSSLRYLVWDTTNILDGEPPRYLSLGGAKNEANRRCKREVVWLD